ncbi:ATP-grasp domain-containing protein [Mesorhizobium australicum]|uniref:ATP-grasp domain-containing protein n=1 Tax=Mesorhizobium australicum TaxID=536018 RepID=UPI003336F05A
MTLLEYEGKALLSLYGIATPIGTLWPEVPDGVREFMVKAQVPIGKRGKAGGVRLATVGSVEEVIEAIFAQRCGGFAVENIYVEERLEIVKELYLAVAIEREMGCHMIIFSSEGGMDIEEVAEDRVLRVPIEPWLGFQPFHGIRIASFLGDAAAGQRLSRTAQALYSLAVDQDAELIEINPLAVVKGGLVAANAKVVLDDNAGFRHSDWAGYARRGERSPLEDSIAATGAVGIEVDPLGDVVAIISGAGLMMATLDLLVSADQKVRAVIDLGGTVLSGSDGIKDVLTAIAPIRPKLTFLNAFLQTAHCDAFALGLAEAHGKCPLQGRIVIRLKGRNAELGRQSLIPLGFELHEDLRPAIEAVSKQRG